ncbi:hypothetical protein LCGC14_2820270, partial [marine sediment metagenome]
MSKDLLPGIANFYMEKDGKIT